MATLTIRAAREIKKLYEAAARVERTGGEVVEPRRDELVADRTRLVAGVRHRWLYYSWFDTRRNDWVDAAEPCRVPTRVEYLRALARLGR